MSASTPREARLVLGIAGSPRRDGNSERMLGACLEGATSAGARVEKIVAAEAGIMPCRGCNACSSTGECVLRDRMHEVYPLLDAADAIVVATPVFFATVPASLKALYDRLQPYWARRHVLGAPAPSRRAGALLIAGGGGDPYGHGCVESVTRSALSVLGVRVDRIVAVEGVDSPSDIGRHPEYLSAAREAGVEIATGGPRDPANGD